ASMGGASALPAMDAAGAATHGGLFRQAARHDSYRLPSGSQRGARGASTRVHLARWRRTAQSGACAQFAALTRPSSYLTNLRQQTWLRRCASLTQTRGVVESAQGLLAARGVHERRFADVLRSYRSRVAAPAREPAGDVG